LRLNLSDRMLRLMSDDFRFDVDRMNVAASDDNVVAVGTDCDQLVVGKTAALVNLHRFIHCNSLKEQTKCFYYYVNF